MTTLNIEPNIADGDEFYEALIEMHRDLTEQESAHVNARLILLLANHVGDMDVLRRALTIAREDVRPTAGPSSRQERAA